MAAVRLLLLCGGQSEEHEVSLASARSVISALGDSMQVTPLVIDRSGRLLDQQGSRLALEAGSAAAGSGSSGLAELQAGGSFDVVFPLLHGPNGEDGSVQGLLQLAQLPFVGSGILGSAVAMDKIMMKTVLQASGLPQVGFSAVTRAQWQSAPQAVLEQLDSAGYPLFVKPANLGSSVGISKAADRTQLAAALELAFGFDRRVIIEEGLEGARELEVGILGNDEPQASPVGEIRFSSEFYDYDTKYEPGRAELLVPAALEPELVAQVQRLAVQAFRQLDLAGLARVDFFLSRDGRLLLNEVNTMPGFTITSMYPRLFEAAGLSYAELIRRLVSLALERQHGVSRPAGTSSR